MEHSRGLYCHSVLLGTVPFLMAAAAAAAAARSALDGGSSMLILEPASERVNFFVGHSLVLAQLNTSYMELDIRRMSARVHGLCRRYGARFAPRVRGRAHGCSGISGDV